MIPEGKEGEFVETVAFWKGVFLVLQEMTLAVHQGKSPREILEAVGEALQELVGVEAGAVVWRGENDVPEVVFVGPPAWFRKIPNVTFPEGLFQNPGGEIQELRTDPQQDPLFPWLSGEARWGLAIPVRASDGMPLAVILALASRPVVLHDAHLMVLRAFRAHVATALENHLLRSHLEHLATTDTLTGLPNRRVFLARLQEELFRLERAFLPRLGAVLVDLDGLKEINDRLGHPAGDTYLQTFAQALQATLRRTDMAARIGGDEFGLLFPGADARAIRRILGRVRQEWHALLPRPFRPHARFSAGVIVFTPDHPPPDPDTVIARTDHALLQAKREGGNRIVFASPTHPPASP